MIANQWMTPDGLREMLRSLVGYEGGQKQLAKRLGISPQYLHDVLAARREPGNRLLAGLGCRRIVVYEILESATSRDAVDPVGEKVTGGPRAHDPSLAVSSSTEQTTKDEG